MFNVTHNTNTNALLFQVCSFGARYHSGYNGGFGCHTFGRKTDHLRSAFMDMLDKHIHPPPPKYELCCSDFDWEACLCIGRVKATRF